MYNKKEYNKKWKKDNPDYQKNYTKNHRLDKRKSKLRCKYGLSLEDWLKMWETQDGKCLICGKKFIKPSDACVDHNHKTGKIRGLLCFQCNMGIGYLQDDPKAMAKAIEYLLR